MDPLEERVAFFIEREMPPAKTFACGFSGGADSTALLLLLKHACEITKRPLLAIHCHHGLRAESDQEAETAQVFAESRGIEFIRCDLNVPSAKKNGESIETAARHLRLAAFVKVLNDRPLPALFLAHHADDCIENLWLRMMRGSNVSGLVSPRPIQIWQGLSIVRPLLETRRAELRTYLEAHEITHSEDNSNSQPVCLRNQIRLELLPRLLSLAPYADGGFTASLKALRADADFIEKSAKKAYETLRGSEGLSRTAFAAEHPALQVRILRYYLESQKLAVIPNGALMTRLKQALEQDQNIRLPLAQDTFLRLTSQTLSVEYTAAFPLPLELEWNPAETPQIVFGGQTLTAQLIPPPEMIDLSDPEIRAARKAFFDAEKIGDHFVLRFPHDGDRILAGGHTSSRLLSELGTKAKRSASERRRQIVMTSPNQTLLWLPGFKRSQTAYVTPKTRHVWFFTILPA